MSQTPRAIILMGVAGSGKTTIGDLLSARLGWPFEDGDKYHPEANRQKMASGIPLTDEDRLPWLRKISEVIHAQLEKGDSIIVACSALKETYRKILAEGIETRSIFVHLKGDFKDIYSRLEKRHGHFMKSGMLESQFATLEEPATALTIDIKHTPEQIVEQICKKL